MELGACIQELEEFNRGQLRSEKTIRFYNQRLSVFSEHAGSDTSLDEIGRDQVRSFMADISDKYAPETVRATTVAVKRLFSWAQDEGIIADNPIAKLKLPRTPRVDKPALTRDELKLILEKGFRKSKAGHRWRAMLVLSVDTGLRVSELCNLKLKDIDFDDGSICVRQGKGAKDRVVFAGQTALHYVKEYIDLYRHKPAYRYRSFVWIGGNNTPIRPVSFRKALYYAGDRLGLKIYPHKLRRTFATMMLLNKADLFTLQELMGHSDISTTRKYIPRDIERLREVHRSASPGDML